MSQNCPSGIPLYLASWSIRDWGIFFICPGSSAAVAAILIARVTARPQKGCTIHSPTERSWTSSATTRRLAMRRILHRSSTLSRTYGMMQLSIISFKVSSSMLKLRTNWYPSHHRRRNAKCSLSAIIRASPLDGESP